MTHADLIDGLRFLLHDREQMSDTGATFFQTATLETALTEALAVTLKGLIATRPRRANITTGALVRTCPTTAAGIPAAVPDDFWTLICGLTAAGHYVPASTTEWGERTLSLTISTVFVSGGYFFGPTTEPAATAVYFRKPPAIVHSTTKLPFFADAVYNAAKSLAAAMLVRQHSKQWMHRFEFFMNEYAAQVPTLQ